jgi:hypothetical protein
LGTLLNFKQYTLTAGTWTPCYLSGLVSKAWLTFPADILIGSSETDATQQKYLSVADNGNEYMIPLPGNTDMGKQTLVCYLTAASGTVEVMLESVGSA